MPKQDKLKTELETQIKRFEKESNGHKNLYRILRYTTIGLTGLATILASAALNFSEIQNWLNMVIVVITATASIVTSVEGLRKPAELWIHERNILYALRDLLREVEYVSETANENDFDNYFTRLQEILTSSKENWIKQITPKKVGSN